MYEVIFTFLFLYFLVLYSVALFANIGWEESDDILGVSRHQWKSYYGHVGTVYIGGISQTMSQRGTNDER